MVSTEVQTATLEIAEGLDLQPDDISGKCVAVLGVRGSGKSSTAAVILEELLKISHPFVVIDIDGEYWGLRERWEVLTAGAGPKVEVAMRPEQTGALAEVVLGRRVPVVLDLSEWSPEEGYAAFFGLAEALWKLAGDLRVPCMLVVEEAHEWLPEGVKTPLRELVARIMLRGRKRGLGGIIVSQRSAKVAKDVLSQAEVIFAHKVVHPADLSVYKDLIPWPAKGVESIVPSLLPGDAVLVRGGVAQEIHVRPRTTFHAGFTPTFEAVPVPPLKAVGEELLETLRSLAAAPAKDADPVEKERRRVRELEALLAEAEKQRDEAEAAARALGYIKVEVIQQVVANLPPAPAVPADIPALPPGALVIPDAKVVPESAAAPTEVTRTTPLPRPVERHLEAVGADLKALPAADRAIVRFLVQREPTEYTLRQLAVWLEYRLSSLQHNPPTRCVALGIVRRIGKGAAARYRADTARFTEERFALFRPGIGDADMAIILERVRKLAAAGGKA